MTKTHDYSKFKAADGPGDNILTQLSFAAQQVLDKEAEIAKLEADLEAAKKEYRELTWFTLPKMMEEAEMEEVVAKNGARIEVGEDIRAGITKANETKAFDWLEKNNQEGMIKRQFTIEFARDEDSWADKFERDLRQRKKPLNVKRKKSVNPQTLSAWVRGELKDGKELPLDLLGVFRQRVAKVTMKE